MINNATTVGPQGQPEQRQNQPGLAETTRVGAPKLPLSDQELVALGEDVKAFCQTWAGRLTGSEFDVHTTTREQARDWLLAVVTVAEAVRELARDHGDAVIRVAKTFGANNKHVAKATGVSPQGASKRSRQIAEINRSTST